MVDNLHSKSSLPPGLLMSICSKVTHQGQPTPSRPTHQYQDGAACAAATCQHNNKRISSGEKMAGKLQSTGQIQPTTYLFL